MTPRDERRGWSTAGLAVMAAALGLVAVPLILWLAVPSLPGRIESPEGFYWAAAEPGSGHPLLLREQFDGRQIVAGSTRYGIPAGEAVACYTGDPVPLRDAARATGRVDDVSLRTGLFHVLSAHFDDLGGGATTYVYRCGPDGAQPLLSWGPAPGFGLRALGLIWLAWTVAWAVGLGIARRSTASSH